MFTRDSKILSHRLTTPLTSVANAVGDVFKPTYNQIIKSLFANGEQGFFYDPNDLSTMFQDAAGTVPVTGAGQPVGLVLDKSKGLALGAERAVNGDFSNGSANWSVSVADATHIVTFADGKVRYQSDTISPVLSLNQVGAVVTGKWYEVTINCSSYVSGSLKIDAGNGAQVVVSGLGTFKTKILASTNVLTLVRNSPNVDLTIDSISVKELAGNHAYQTNAASRPLLQRNATTGAYYLAFDGSDDFLQTANIDFTATDKISLFAGVRRLVDSTQIIAELSRDTNGNTGAFALVAGSDLGGIGYTSMARGTASINVSQVASNFTYPAPDTAVLSAKHDISGSLSSMRRNGVVGIDGVGNKGAGNFGNYPLYIGRRGGVTFPFTGHIYGLIGIGKLTTEIETVAIEKELAKRTGVTLSV